MGNGLLGRPSFLTTNRDIDIGKRWVMKITPIIFIGALLMLLPIAARAEQSMATWEAEGIALEKETGIPRLHLPNNIPPQQSPSKEPPSKGLVHCTIWAAGRTDYVSIWLARPDCEAWGKAAMEYNTKYGAVLEQVKARHLAQRNSAEEAGRQQQARSGRIIYSLFQCIPNIGQCQMLAPPRVSPIGGGTVMPGTIYRSLADCEQDAKRISGLITPPSSGRYLLPSGLWLECRGKHVDTWEPVH